MNAVRWILLTLYLATPYRLAEMIGMQVLPYPTGIHEEFRIGFPFVGVIDAVMYAVAVATSVMRPPQLVIVALLPPGLLGASLMVTSDVGVTVACAVAPFVLYMQLARRPQGARAVVTHLAVCLGVLALLVAMTGSTANEYDERFRINLPGLDVTSTGHVFAWLLVATYLLWRGACSDEGTSRRMLVLGMLLSFAGLMLSGARTPQAFAFATLAVVECQRRLSGDYSLLPPLGVIAAVLVAYAALMTGLIDPAALIADDVDLDLSVIGRGAAWTAATTAMTESPWPALSNWVVQARLEDQGYPSHSHSALLQFAQVFGVPLFSLLLVMLVGSLVISLRREWRMLTLLWLSIQLFDYNYTHAKFWAFTALVILIARLQSGSARVPAATVSRVVQA